MSNLTPLLSNLREENLLNAALTEFYAGPLGFPQPADRLPNVFANFVTSIDGRITLDQPGRVGGGEISMFNLPDRKLMAVLRTLAGGVLMGANTLRLEPDHIWTAEFLLGDQPEFLAACTALRRQLKLNPVMPHYFLTRSGSVLPETDRLPAVFSSDQADIHFLTTEKGVKQLKQELGDKARYQAHAFGEQEVDLQEALRFVRSQGVVNLLCEGGPTVIGELLGEKLLNEVFLTEAPHVVGDRLEPARPDRKTWVANYHGRYGQTALAELVSLKINDGYLFKRYRFN